MKLSAPVTESFAGSTAFVAGQTGSIRVTPSSGAGEYAGTYTDLITIEITG